MHKFIEISELYKTFSENGKTTTAIDHVNLSIPENQFTVLIGPSGCGKTTLLNTIAGFEDPTSGTVKLKGKEIRNPGPDRGYVFQDYALFPWLTVIDNIAFGLRHNGVGKKEAREKAADYLTLVNLSGFEKAYPHTLSAA